MAAVNSPLPYASWSLPPDGPVRLARAENELLAPPLLTRGTRARCQASSPAQLVVLEHGRDFTSLSGTPPFALQTSLHL